MKTLTEKLKALETSPPHAFNYDSDLAIEAAIAIAVSLVEAHTCKYTKTDSGYVAECGYDCDDHLNYCAWCGGRIVE